MVTQADFNISDKEKQPDSTSGGVQLGVPSSGASQGASPQGQQGSQQSSPQGQAQQQNAPTSSGRFTNINQYLQANKGFNEAGGGLAGKVTSNITGQVNNAQNQFGQAQNDFNTQANAGRVQYDPGVVQNATQNAAQFVQDPNNVSAYTRLRDATYGGPTALNDATISQQAGNLQTMGNMAQTEPGRAQVLQQLYSNPNYTQGQQSLDNLLLTSNPDQLKSLQTLSPLTSQLTGNIAAGEGQAAAQAANYAQEAADTQKQARDALTGAATGIDTSLQQKAAQDVSDQQSTLSRLQNEIGSGKISASDLSMLGLQPQDVSSLYGMSSQDILKNLSASPTATKQSVASADQAAQLQALAQLGGTALPNVGSLASEYGSNIGTYKGPVNFASDIFKNQLAQAQAGADTQLKPTQQFLQGAQDTLKQRQDALSLAQQLAQNSPSASQQMVNNLQGSQSNNLDLQNKLVSQLSSLYGGDNQLMQKLGLVNNSPLTAPNSNFNVQAALQEAQQGVNDTQAQVSQRQAAFDALKQKLGYGQGLQVV